MIHVILFYFFFKAKYKIMGGDYPQEKKEGHGQRYDGFERTLTRTYQLDV